MRHVTRVAGLTPRRGFTVTELIVSAIVTGTVGLIVLTAKERSVSDEKVIRDRVAAIAEVENLMQRITSRSLVTQEVADAAVAKALGSPALDRLSTADLSVAVVATRNGEKRVAITLKWNGRSGIPTRPVRLVAYHHENARQP